MSLDYTQFPPTPVSETPLHPPHRMDPGRWWACSRPESPSNGMATYDWRCHGCVTAATVHLTLDGDREQDWQHREGESSHIVRLSWLVDRARYWLDAA